MLTYIQGVLAIFYITKILLFEEKTSHFGPMKSDSKVVYNDSTKHVQPVTLFDYVRQIIPFLNPYHVNNELWEVNESKMERWTCPTCLSFWTAFLFTVPLFFLKKLNLLDLVLYHFGIVGAVTMIFSFLKDNDYGFMLRGETTKTINVDDESTEY